MRKPTKYSKELKEFEINGFVKSSDESDLLTQLRRHYGRYLKKFSAGHNISIGTAGAKYGSYDLFGDRICYYYDIRKEENFIDFLVKKFLEKNPDPNSEIRKVFTRILHTYGLCWFGCIHRGKKRFY